MMKLLSKIPGLLLVILNLTAFGQSTEKQYLSGKDSENTVNWEFFCTDGRKSGMWQRIAVPSHWEQEGFGKYDYGRDYRTYGKGFRFADEKGMYKYTFKVPEDWKDKIISIVFEGSMTDTEVKINGEPAGPTHQGSFYRFKYDITDKLRFGEKNVLEATVSKMSENKSVNRAERYADYWIFGGIYRPVYLEAMPKAHISHLAVAAKADGSILVEAEVKNIKEIKKIQAEILDQNGKVISTFSEKVKKNPEKIQLNSKLEGIQTWTAETPSLYKIRVSLINGDSTYHQVEDKFGFRTIEIRKGDGIFVNGTKVKFKGINRHSFWPETGRALTPEQNLLDVKLMKEMNMNAVRCSHYPPDDVFLDYCDSLGLYVIDELAGWQNAYDTESGEKLVKELVRRDVNHPSILLWSNGNEGGHNFDLDDDYLQYDPSKRPVIHAHHKPGNDFNGIDCNHYESYYSAQKILKEGNIYMPTEFLHGQDDGGSAAALADYWDLFWNTKNSAGGFLWVFSDEGLVRTDLNNRIDVNRLNAPDGVVGPHREKEGNFFALKEIWSPIVIQQEKLDSDFDGSFEVENRYHFTNLNDCRFKWELVNFYQPADWQQGYEVIAGGTQAGPDVVPVAKGKITLPLSSDWKEMDALRLTAYDPAVEEVLTWTWAIKDNPALLSGIVKLEGGDVEVSEVDTAVTLTANDISFSISKKDGQIFGLKRDRSMDLLFGDGPVLTEGEAAFDSLKHFKEGDAYVIECSYTGDLTAVQWKMYGSGWVALEYTYDIEGEFKFPGISFTYPESNIISAKWLGDGPYRVWKNRMAGTNLNVWENLYNNTQTGYSPWIYPEFKGYFSDIKWMRINTSEGAFLVASKEDDLFVRLFDFSGISGPRKFYPELPKGNLSFLDGIPPIGTKLATGIDGPGALGPMSKPNRVDGPVSRTLYFYFGLLE